MLTESQISGLKNGQKLMLKRGEDSSYLRADVFVISTKDAKNGTIVVRLGKMYAHGGHIDVHSGDVIRAQVSELSL